MAARASFRDAAAAGAGGREPFREDADRILTAGLERIGTAAVGDMTALDVARVLASVVRIWRDLAAAEPAGGGARPTAPAAAPPLRRESLAEWEARHAAYAAALAKPA